MKKAVPLLFVLLILIAGCNITNTEEISVSTSQSSSAPSSQTESMKQNESKKSERLNYTQESENEGEQMSDKAQIIAEFQKRNDAMVNKDTEYLRSVMGDTVRHITGRTQTIDEWLQDVEDEKMKYYSIKIEDPIVTIDGDTATLTCTNVLDARIYGSRGTWRLQGVGTFEKIDGEWRMVIGGKR